MEPYPRLLAPTMSALQDAFKQIGQLRDRDIVEFNNLANRFLAGRKVGKVPANSLDTAGNRVGDFNYDASYLYVCVDNAGTAAWRRVALSSW